MIPKQWDGWTVVNMESFPFEIEPDVCMFAYRYGNRNRVQRHRWEEHFTVGGKDLYMTCPICGTCGCVNFKEKSITLTPPMLGVMIKKNGELGDLLLGWVCEYKLVGIVYPHGMWNIVIDN